MEGVYALIYVDGCTRPWAAAGWKVEDNWLTFQAHQRYDDEKLPTMHIPIAKVEAIAAFHVQLEEFTKLCEVLGPPWSVGLMWTRGLTPKGIEELLDYEYRWQNT